MHQCQESPGEKDRKPGGKTRVKEIWDTENNDIQNDSGDPK